MKFLTIVSVFILSLSAGATDNLSDAIDKNEIPAEQEQRENEILNQPDAMDPNAQPNTLEDRAQEEEWRESYDEVQEDMRKQNKKLE